MDKKPGENGPPDMPLEFQPKEEQPTGIIVEIRVTGTDINIIGPVQDLMLMYGILERAKDAVRQFHINQNQPRIQQANMLPPRGKFRL